MKAITTIICYLLAISGFSFISNPPQKKLTLIFHHQLGNEELVLGNTFKNILGENITIHRLKYYVSNFSVTDEKGKKIILPVQYFLVDESDSLSKKITFNIPDISINTIHFLLGVDSIKNVSGVQTGALDPLKGMFWTWNTGYIMAKLEGESESSASAGHRFTYHIGGFRNGMNTVKKIELAVQNHGKQILEIHISADINHWFKNKSEIRIAEIPVCHSPGTLAMKIADNYSNMFSINSIR